MSTKFNFNSYGNSTQNNNIVINNNMDEILERLKEINVPPNNIENLKYAIINDKDETDKTKNIGKNVKQWCLNILDKIATDTITGPSVFFVKDKIKEILSTIYHFPIQF